GVVDGSGERRGAERVAEHRNAPQRQERLRDPAPQAPSVAGSQQDQRRRQEAAPPADGRSSSVASSASRPKTSCPFDVCRTFVTVTSTVSPTCALARSTTTMVPSS